MAANLNAIPELETKDLREFGLTTGAIIAALFGLLLPWLLSLGYPLWPWIIGAVLGGWGLAAPDTLRPVYRGWMRFGLLMSRITTPLILGIVFFVMIAPIAALMRLFGRDAMAKQLDKRTETFRVASKKAPRQNMEKPF